VSVGDRLLAINGNRIIDVLDYKYYAYDRHLHLDLLREDGSAYSLHVEKNEGGELGLDFQSYLMDAPRSCANNCVFCFIDQLPKGMRPTMYFKDDDARLSFLLGNYITLTNLSDREVQRIIDLHVSPVNVSVHTTNPELRCRMLRNPHAGRGLKLMQRFAEGGIQMNCQIVCCPGWNDGEALQYTMEQLAALYPGVHSVSIVPVGLTRFREGLEKLEPFTPEHAAETIDQITAFGDECVKKFGTRIFWCGDELYLEAGRELPPDEFYEEHTQLENGVGMLRLLETEFRSALKLSDAPDGVPFSIATGVAAAPFFEGLLALARERYPQLDGRVYAIENDFFGHSITVAGLITGQDLIRQLKGRELGRRLFISQNMLRREEMDFLDDVTLEDAVKALGLPIYPTEADGFALWDAISGDLLPEIRSPREGEVTEYYRYNQN
jgi:putative radical SAM enzyme (TIGR03279 family)